MQAPSIISIFLGEVANNIKDLPLCSKKTLKIYGFPIVLYYEHDLSAEEASQILGYLDTIGWSNEGKAVISGLELKFGVKKFGSGLKTRVVVFVRGQLKQKLEILWDALDGRSVETRLQINELFNMQFIIYPYYRRLYFFLIINNRVLSRERFSVFKVLETDYELRTSMAYTRIDDRGLGIFCFIMNNLDAILDLFETALEMSKK